MRSDSLLAAPNTLLRLCVRWYALIAIWFVLMATFSPALFLGDDGFDVLAGHALTSGRDATRLARQLMLQIGVTLPLVIGALVSGATHELLSTPMSWTLPLVRRRMLSGHALVLLPLTMAVGFGALARTDVHTAVVAACAATFWYALGINWLTMGHRPVVAYPLMGMAIIALVRPSWYAAAMAPTVASWPITIAVGALVSALGVSLMLQHTGAASGRAAVGMGMRTRRLGMGDMTLGPAFGRRTAVLSRADGSVRQTLTDWVEAAFIESSWSTRAGLLGRGAIFALLSLFLWVANGQIGILSFSIVQHGLQLSGQLAYPLSRAQRANVQFLCCLVDVVILGVISSCVFVVLERFQVPRTLMGVPSNPVDWRLDLMAVLVLSPISQWFRALGPLALVQAKLVAIVPMTLVMIGALALPRGLDELLNQPGRGVLLLILAAIGVGVQLLHYVALHYVYARRDLVRSI